MFILLAESSSGSGMWPVFIARCASVPVLAVAAVVLGHSPRMVRADIAPVAGAGLCDVGANALVVLAVRRGLLSLVAPVASLYPATTVCSPGSSCTSGSAGSEPAALRWASWGWR